MIDNFSTYPLTYTDGWPQYTNEKEDNDQRKEKERDTHGPHSSEQN